MVSVFLSYDRDDVGFARPIAAALEKSGHSVWWDQHIKGGAQYSKEIDRALKAADAVVVLWSERSVESAWVRDEAAAGRDSGRLVPATLDSIEPPLGFRQYQTIDLSRWSRRMTAARLAPLIDAIVALPESELEADGQPPPNREMVKHRSLARIAIPAAVTLLIAATAASLITWQPWSSDEATTVAIGPADASRASSELSQSLTVKLGSLATAKAGSMRLIGYEDRSRQDPDLMLEASATDSGNATRASLVLKSARDRAILWSRDFEQPSVNLADLKQQIAFAAARVLGCALEGMQSEKRLKLESLKLYLNACSELADLAGTDPRPVIPMLVAVTEDEPGFAPAWARLLLAESEIISLPFNEAERDPRTENALRVHIDRARELNSNMAEAFLAESTLLPARSFGAVIALVERASQEDPDNPAVLSHRSTVFARVGRTKEGVQLAERAAELDPLSPAALHGYIAALAYSGRRDAAERELREAERLWSGTVALRGAQFRFHYRYGDPKLALAMEESDSSGGMPRLYLRTRIAPTRENVNQLIAQVRQRLDTMRNPSAGIGFTTLAYGAFGNDDELFRLLLNWYKPDDLGTISEVFFRPELQRFRHDPRFMQVAKIAGLLDYWRASGKWPDFCFEPNQPYDCKNEAARLFA